MKNNDGRKVNVLLALPGDLEKKLQVEAVKECRKRHAQIIFILERFFETNTKKEKTK